MRLDRSNQYDSFFYRNNVDTSYKSALTLLSVLFEKIHADSIVDFGCGAGTWLKAAKDLGTKEIFGVDFGNNMDYLMIDKDEFMKRDLTTDIDLSRKFDFAMSLEVAEHLPETSAAIFVNTLCRHSDVILFSAAIPGQGGTDHINEQWQSYWGNLFAEHNFFPIDAIRFQIWDNENISVWYRQNTILYVASHKRQEYYNLFGNSNFPMDIVHPILWKARAVSLLHPKRYRFKENIKYKIRKIRFELFGK